jgi:predicted SAM-dependent methyltransferase
MKTAIKKALQKFHLHALVRAILDIGLLLKYQIVRKFGLVDRQIVVNYLKQNEIRKLHIGSGENNLSGWLNSDRGPELKNVLNLDATEPFPLDPNEFDYVFSEHMIEHISYSEGLLMLNECFRVLRKNGTIRISTPNLPFLIDLYKEDKSNLQLEYIKWSTDNFITDVDCYEDTFVINNFVRDWGHQFIYDEKTLRMSLEKAGFTNITRYDLNQSEHDSLKNLENEDRLPAGFLRLETISLEGTKLVDS